MTAISIQSEKTDEDTHRFRAIAGSRESVGRTPGEALDALNAQLGDSESGSLIIVQQFQSDPYFSEEQYLRMRALLDNQRELTEAEQRELEQIVKDELMASAHRADAIASALGR